MKSLASVSRDTWRNALLGLLLLPALYATHLYNHTLSHSMAEIFSALVSLAIFLFTWNARPFLTNRYYVFIGVGCLFIGALDFLHAEAYEGMFQGDEANLPGQLWYAARYLQGASLLIAPLFCAQPVRPGRLMLGYGVVTLVLLASIFAWPVFPKIYVEGIGITGFKTFSDYFVSLLLLGSMGTLYLKREHFDERVLQVLFASVAFSIASELAFNLYRDYYVYNNLVGHYLKIVSFYLFYKAVIATGLFRPYDVLFRNLTRSEAELRIARDGLEARVAERTSELLKAKERLEGELAERLRMERERELTLRLLRLINSAPDIRTVATELEETLGAWAGCESVELRLRTGGDFPYVGCRGHAEDLVAAESHLAAVGRNRESLRDASGDVDLECVCGQVVSGRSDADAPYATRGGSFWTNDAAGWLEGAPARLRPATLRGRCAMEGYASVALVPLRVGVETFGLLQLRDRREGRFTPERIQQLERVGSNVATALGRMAAQEALRASEDRFRSLVENSAVGTVIVLDGRVVYRNPEQATLPGAVPDGFEFRRLEGVLPEDAAKFEALCVAMDSGPAARREVELRFQAEGSEQGGKGIRWVHCRTTPIEYQGARATLVNMVDVTRVRELEQAVAVREKMASLGHLAAGIAHEIRNPLSGINLNISTIGHLCRSSPDLPEGEKERIDAVIGHAMSASEKIASVIRSVMEFSKPVPQNLGRVDANRVIGKAVAFSTVAMRKRGIDLAQKLDPELPECRADSRLLEQVLLNLITNAAEALESVDGPRRIEVSSSREGDAVVLKVSDTGPGVPFHLREKIFDPFFTTRKEGYGIGLSFSHRVISEHGGALTVAGSPMGGAEFRIGLPLGKRDRCE